MNIWDFVVGAVLVLIIAGAIIATVKRKKKGGCCGGSCGECSCCNDKNKHKK
ncbi:MAG TPA: hypothetical protein DCY15_03995 [Ruminococcaceae bacterium]|nr:hypothetical protein [Oscillospiraceae bacterium]